MKKPRKEWTRNEAVEMMHTNTSKALEDIAGLIKRTEMEREEIIEYLIELSEELGAQALVVALRDELHFSKPKY